MEQACRMNAAAAALIAAFAISLSDFLHGEQALPDHRGSLLLVTSAWKAAALSLLECLPQSHKYSRTAAQLLLSFWEGSIGAFTKLAQHMPSWATFLGSFQHAGLVTLSGMVLSVAKCHQQACACTNFDPAF